LARFVTGAAIARNSAVHSIRNEHAKLAQNLAKEMPYFMQQVVKKFPVMSVKGDGRTVVFRERTKSEQCKLDWQKRVTNFWSKPMPEGRFKRSLAQLRRSLPATPWRWRVDLAEHVPMVKVPPRDSRF
jgi:hypothetical protein